MRSEYISKILSMPIEALCEELFTNLKNTQPGIMQNTYDYEQNLKAIRGVLEQSPTERLRDMSKYLMEKCLGGPRFSSYIAMDSEQDAQIYVNALGEIDNIVLRKTLACTPKELNFSTLIASINPN